MRSDSFDERLLRWIDGHRVDALTSFASTLMDLSLNQWLVWSIALTGAGFAVYRRAWRAGLAVAVAFYTAAIVSALLKAQIERARPAFPDALVQVSGYAMPSSHAAFTMAMTVALLIVVRWHSRRSLLLAAAALGAGAILVGSAMIYLGAHWATDVLAGWVLGAAIGACSGLVFKRRERSA